MYNNNNQLKNYVTYFPVYIIIITGSIIMNIIL